MSQKLDIVLFGVTGFTGKNALPYLHKLTSAKGRNLTWGVAGRNENKIQAILDDFANKLCDKTISKKPIIIVDILDNQSIKHMTSKARLIINCCGPYKLMGENVVKSCIETGTHHVDVSGERLFMEKTQLLYNEKAREKGVYIVSACGFDSIPADLGAIFLQQNFKGTLNSIETYAKLDVSTINSGTWNSAVHEVADIKQLRGIRAKLFITKLPSLEPKLKKRFIPFKSNVDKYWATVFPGTDRSVMMRTQRYLYEEKKQRPIQVETYMLINSLRALISLAFVGMLFSVLVKFKLGRYLLLKYPSVITLGFVASGEPSQEAIENSKFSVTLVGKGWNKKADVDIKRPNREIVARVEGTDPAYGTTVTCLVLAAIVILTESSKLPKKGGVFSPGAAFGETSLISQLRENNVSFNVVREANIIG